MRKVEKWIDVVGYESLYQVSDKGRVRSKDRAIKTTEFSRVKRGKVLKQIDNSRGYLRVQLVDADGSRRRVFVHRLVAFHFVENADPATNTVVNHLDANPHNNRADNLERTTAKGNSEHASMLGHLAKDEKWKRKIKEGKKNRTAVIGTNQKTGEELRFGCMNDCRMFGFQPSCVHRCCRGKQMSHKGYRWRYAE